MTGAADFTASRANYLANGNRYTDRGSYSNRSRHHSNSHCYRTAADATYIND